ncbi:MAG: ABC transporter ATP-binding protein [Pseudomonadota bacterium]|nr:ABC transporter ATP-binding protein [Pseudomonadota bacterium]
MASIGIRDIRKDFGTVTAVDDFSLEIEDGEFVVLVGPSGCGKTTTLRMLAGLETPTGGAIRLGARDITHLEARARNIAMVFQTYALYPHMTVAENVSFALRLAGRPKAEIDAAVKRAAGLMDIGHLLHRRPRELSGGQRQRVAVCRAIVRDPEAFLFDEPLSNLDARLRTQARSEIRRLQRRLGVTTVYVTHDQVEAMTMADRIVVMDKGVVQQVGAPLEIYARPANTFVAGFIGSPPMNLLPVEVGHRDNGAAVSIGTTRIAVDRRLPAGAAQIGFRPEDVHLAESACARPLALRAEVTDAEALGAETVLQVDSPAGAFQCRTPGIAPVTPGATVDLFLDRDRLHLFGAGGVRIEGWRPAT